MSVLSAVQFRDFFSCLPPSTEEEEKIPESLSVNVFWGQSCGKKFRPSLQVAVAAAAIVFCCCFFSLQRSQNALGRCYLFELSGLLLAFQDEKGE